MVLQRIANPRPPGLLGSIPSIGIKGFSVMKSLDIDLNPGWV